MIIGNGIIANTFKSGGYNWDDVLIFASGVSNSKTTDPSTFQREEELLKLEMSKGIRLIYFSTISIFDPSLKDSAYVKHKARMEELLKNSSCPALVLRLPIVVSHSNNPNQLFGYLKTKILGKERITIFKKATRYLLDLSDLESIVHLLLSWQKRKGERFSAINIVFQEAITMEEVGNFIVQKHPDIPVEFLEIGMPYSADGSLFEEACKISGIEGFNSSPKAILEKYLA